MLFDIRAERIFHDTGTGAVAFDFIVDCATRTEACLFASKVLGEDPANVTTTITVEVMSLPDISENVFELRDFRNKQQAVSHAAQRAEALSV